MPSSLSGSNDKYKNVITNRLHVRNDSSSSTNAVFLISSRLSAATHPQQTVITIEIKCNSIQNNEKHDDSGAEGIEYLFILLKINFLDTS